MNKVTAKWYAFTWAPKGNTIDAESDNIRFMLDHFRRWRKALQFAMYPEVNTNGNVHYHGIISEITDKIAWYKRLLPALKRQGFVCIKGQKEDNQDKWKQYITKDEELKKALFGKWWEITNNNVMRRTPRSSEKESKGLDYGIEYKIPTVVRLLQGGKGIKPSPQQQAQADAEPS